MRNTGLAFISLISIALLLACVAPACGTGPGAREAGKAIASCTAGEARGVVDQIAPLADAAITRATGADGSVDASVIKAAGSSLLSSALRCAFATAVLYAVTRTTTPGAPASEGHEPDPAQLRAAFEDLRATSYDGMTFETPAGQL